MTPVQLTFNDPPDGRLTLSTVHRAKEAQKRYFLGLFEGRCDLDYARGRLKVGSTHERLGIEPRYYLGAYAHYLRLIHDRLGAELADKVERDAAYRSIEKIVFFDTSLAIDAYVKASLDTLARQQAAIRELATPVIRVHERVLLLPLVGTIDTLRAHQIMETVLTRIVEEQAKVIILDIAGVPVVDTKVADHLIQTTAAVRLLGAETVLTGISPQLARTIVQLGVNITAMHTQSRLSDGIEFALAIVGRAITRKPVLSGVEGTA